MKKKLKALIKVSITLFYKSLSKIMGVYISLFQSKFNVILFGARNGYFYMDNSRALFEWIMQNNKEHRIFWVTNDHQLYKALKKDNIPVLKPMTLKGIYLTQCAKIGIISNRLKDIAYFTTLIPKNTNIVFLGHGLPIKNYRLTVKKGINEGFKQEINSISRMTSFAVSSSDFIAKHDSKCTGIDAYKYKITGLPRNDKLLKVQDSAKEMWTKISKNVPESVRTILYAPTWRMHGSATELFPFADFDNKKFVRLLENHKVTLLLRPHFQDVKNSDLNKKIISELVKHTKFVKLISVNECEDVNDLLPFVDVLITDYSSIYLDFLLLDRPVWFFPYDYKDFEQQNGFLYDYFENLSGPAINTFKDFCHQIEILSKGLDPYADKRNNLKKKFHKYQDDRSCERISRLLDLMIDNL